MTIAVVIAAMFFLAYLQAGRERQTLIRCHSCGSLYGEKHHPDCQWGN